jgi:hypothetical protein
MGVGVGEDVAVACVVSRQFNMVQNCNEMRSARGEKKSTSQQAEIIKM